MEKEYLLRNLVEKESLLSKQVEKKSPLSKLGKTRLMASSVRIVVSCCSGMPPLSWTMSTAM